MRVVKFFIVVRFINAELADERTTKTFHNIDDDIGSMSSFSLTEKGARSTIVRDIFSEKYFTFDYEYFIPTELIKEVRISTEEI